MSKFQLLPPTDAKMASCLLLVWRWCIASLWINFYTFMTICLKNWPGKHTRFHFFQHFSSQCTSFVYFSNIVRLNFGGFLTSNSVLFYYFWANLYINHISILSVFSKKMIEKKKHPKTKLIKKKHRFLWTFLILSWNCTHKKWILCNVISC